jgi:hypothetical protein
MKIYQKLLEAKKQIGKVSKNAKNPHFKNNYADINALIEAVEPILLDNGLLLLQPVINGKVVTQIIDIESCEKIESILTLDANLNSQQQGSQITYFRRYTLQSLMSLQAEDDDANTASKVKKPTLSDKAFSSAIERMINGEVELFAKLKDSYTLTPQQELECKEVLG